LSITKRGDYIIEAKQITSSKTPVEYNLGKSEIFLNRIEVQRIVYQKS
jgi:hypothetical protein